MTRSLFPFRDTNQRILHMHQYVFLPTFLISIDSSGGSTLFARPITIFDDAVLAFF